MVGFITSVLRSDNSMVLSVDVFFVAAAVICGIERTIRHVQ